MAFSCLVVVSESGWLAGGACEERLARWYFWMGGFWSAEGGRGVVNSVCFGPSTDGVIPALATRECDSPLRLTNFTLDYLAKNWADEIDFVVWTGDNARYVPATSYCS